MINLHFTWSYTESKYLYLDACLFLLPPTTLHISLIGSNNNRNDRHNRRPHLTGDCRDCVAVHSLNLLGAASRDQQYISVQKSSCLSSKIVNIGTLSLGPKPREPFLASHDADPPHEASTVRSLSKSGSLQVVEQITPHTAGLVMKTWIGEWAHTRRVNHRLPFYHVYRYANTQVEEDT